ncbi:MAG TPA: tRNA lysidine(34) synthetase TilS [Pseudolabrys sp.]
MPTAKKALPSIVSAAELAFLFSDLETVPSLVLAVSGGPDSTALMLLAAHWRDTLARKPELIAVTVDHGLRKESKAEAAAVGKLARTLGISHRTVRWTGKKPSTGLQQAARAARYRLLGEAARKAGASHILTAHTLDDQAETVLIRMSRGSGIAGLGAMQRVTSLANGEGTALLLLRPLLDIPKARLVATLLAAEIPFADDPSNRDPRFTRARLRALMPELAEEGLDARRLALLAQRLKRADAAVEASVARARTELSLAGDPDTIAFDAKGYAGLAAEVGLRLIGCAVAEAGDEGPVELGKLEALKEALDDAQKARNGRFRRSLAGATVTLAGPRIVVERAPPRRSKTLTTPRRARDVAAKPR